jgi:hypothetical protein
MAVKAVGIKSATHSTGFREDMSCRREERGGFTRARCPKTPCCERTTTPRGCDPTSPREPCSVLEKERQSVGKLFNGSATTYSNYRSHSGVDGTNEKWVKRSRVNSAVCSLGRLRPVYMYVLLRYPRVNGSGSSSWFTANGLICHDASTYKVNKMPDFWKWFSSDAVLVNMHGTSPSTVRVSPLTGMCTKTSEGGISPLCGA